jgi:hypothetical protein
MSTIINATKTNGVVIQPDNSGSLVLQTNNGTTALTIDTSQNATFAGTLTATGKLVASSMPTGSVLQVVNTIKTNSFSTTSTTFTDVTGLSVSITPSSSSSTILVIASVTGIGTDVPNAGATGFILVRNSTTIAQGTGGTVNFTGHLSNRNLGGTAHTLNSALSYLDSPSTASAITYKIQGRAEAGTLYVNRDPDNQVSVSTITVMEIKG